MRRTTRARWAHRARASATPRPHRARSAHRHSRHSRLATLAVLVVGLLATGSIYALVAPTSPAQAAAEPAPGGDAARGKALFLANCSTCHGRNAEGASDGPSLVGVGAAAVDFQVGTGRMPLRQQGPQAPRGRVLFSPEQRADLAAYVASLGPGPAIPTAEQLEYEEFSAEEIAEGGEIYRTNCSMCHNFAGVGGALTQGKYAPSLQGSEPVYIYEAMLTGPQSMPVFPDTTLPPEDKRKIIGYLKSIAEEPSAGGASLGRLGPVTEGLVGWLVGIGGLVAAAVWLGAKAK